MTLRSGPRRGDDPPHCTVLNHNVLCSHNAVRNCDFGRASWAVRTGERGMNAAIAVRRARDAVSHMACE